MKIEIHGGQLKNKGAQKMLRTTVEKFSKSMKNVELYCDPVCGNVQDLQEIGIKTFSTSRGWMGGRLFFLKFFLQRLLGLIKTKNSISQIDAFIDISGFAYSDQWSEKPARDTLRLVNFYKKQKKPIIFLPQAFGPFANKYLFGYMFEIIRKSDLVYARDKKSLAYLRNVTNSHKLKLCPDITFDFSNKFKRVVNNYNLKKIALIPNSKVINSKLFSKKDSYLCKIEQLSEISSNFCLEILIHDDSGEDIDLVKKSKKLSKLKIFEIKDAKELKLKINNYDLIISSRYHGLVAAISQGIPVISIGWSHKYDELMSSYLLGKYNFTKKNQDLLSLVNNLGDNKNYHQIQKLINEKNKKSIIQLNKMWKDVIDLINEKNSSYSIR